MGRGPAARVSALDVEGEVGKLPVYARTVVENLMAHAKKSRVIFKGGPNQDYPTCGYYYRIAGQTRSLWSLWPVDGGTISINFASVARADHDRAKHLLETLKENSVLAAQLSKVQPDELHAFPRLDVNDLVRDDAWQTLLHGFDAVIDKPA